MLHCASVSSGAAMSCFGSIVAESSCDVDIVTHALKGSGCVCVM